MFYQLAVREGAKLAFQPVTSATPLSQTTAAMTSGPLQPPGDEASCLKKVCRSLRNSPALDSTLQRGFADRC